MKMLNKICILSVGLLSMASCKKYLAVNTTPNNPTTVPPSVLLPTTTIAIAFANQNDLNRASSALIQHIAGVANQTQQYDIYNLAGNFDNQWNNELYDGAIVNCRQLIAQDSATSPAYSGIAKLELAYAFSLCSDIWGDVPYSQAGFGTKFLTPRFDKQADIYQGNAALGITSLFDLVNSGLADLAKPSALKPGKDDLVYGGNLANWTKMGNTLLLKFAIQLTNINPTLATSTISAVVAGNNYINANNLDFAVPFGASVGNQNPLYTFNYLNRPGDQMLSQRLLNLMTSLNDTVRLAQVFSKPTGTFVGFDNGANASAPAQATRSQYAGTYLIGTTGSAPARLLTNFQVQFILAEAALLLGTPGTANTYYQAGITAAMQEVGMSAGQITAYFTANPTIVTLTGTTAQMEQQIITEKYIAWIGNGVEAYDDYRRTGYPVLALVNNPAGDDPSVIPTRLPYTNLETSSNINCPNPRPKTDVKLWWAK
jgi:hypothetical protein